jgi:nucleoside-diphosphate-sugar epimerase
MKTLITGAGGFVGGALWRRCVELGWTVLATGRRPHAGPGYLAQDLRDPLRLPDGFRPDVIVHVAARSSPWGSQAQFSGDNIIATRRVLECVRQCGCPHVIHISTAAVLYVPRHQPHMDEETPFADPPANRYAATKQAAETLVSAYEGPWTILRPRAVFGPGDTVLFPRILRAARRGRLPRIVGEQPVFADLIYIDTLVEYIVRSARLQRTGLYHVSNADPVELWPFLEEVLQRLDLPLPARTLSARRALALATMVEGIHRVLPFLGEPPLTRFGVGVFAYTKTLDVRKALRDLGPPAVDLRTGVDRFVAWQRSLS